MSNSDQTVIAVVDDDLELGSLIGEYLQSNGLACELYESGERFLESDYSSVSLLVLDVGLPGMDGFAVCRELRNRSSIPIIMLTAASDDVDRILGLELGADDYMGKPFNPRELLARIKAALRRVQVGAEKTSRLTVSHSDRRGFWDGQLIDLTGAGDLFAAGYLHGVVNNMSEVESLMKGTELSSKIIQKIGARI